jgi:hypothetical protein
MTSDGPASLTLTQPGDSADVFPDKSGPTFSRRGITFAGKPRSNEPGKRPKKGPFREKRALIK